MATRQSTSKRRGARNLSRRAVTEPVPLRSGIEALLSTEVAMIADPLERAIERERHRLIFAESILDCALGGLRLAAGGEVDLSLSQEPALSLARSLIRETVNQLDPTYIDPLRKPGPSNAAVSRGVRSRRARS